MTIKVNIDYYASKVPFLNKMLHTADNEGDGNGMLDQEVEVSCFLKLSKIESNKENLKKYGIEVIDNGSNSFSIRKVKDGAETVLSYDLNEGTLSQIMSYKCASYVVEYTGRNKLKCTQYNGPYNIGSWTQIDEKVYNDPATFEQVMSYPSIFGMRKYDKQANRAFNNQL